MAGRLRDAIWLAERLGVSRRTIYRMAAAGKVPHYRIGNGLILFDEGQISEWLEEKRVDPGQGVK